MSTSSSYRQILKAATLSGSASVANAIVAIMRTKLLALMLGPAGIGLIGLYTSILQTATGLATLGIGTSGVRQISEALDHNAPERVQTVRAALFTTLLTLGTLGMLLVWAFSGAISTAAFGSETNKHEVQILSVGVAFGLLASYCTTSLQGFRQISSLARASVVSALCSSTIGVVLVYVAGPSAIVYLVLLMPLAAAIVGLLYTARLPAISRSAGWKVILHHSRALVELGVAFMGAGLLWAINSLLIRSVVTRQFGLETTGYLQASWAISLQYFDIALAAMWVDFFPRLARSRSEPLQTVKVLNEQAEVAVLLVGPVLIAVIIFAPYLLAAFYSANFVFAESLLRWQVLGIAIKLNTWPLTAVILANGDGKTYFWSELLWNITYLGAVAVGTSQGSLSGAGIGFVAAYGVQLLFIHFRVRKTVPVRWETEPRILRWSSVGVALLTLGVIEVFEDMPLIVAVPVVVAVAGASLLRLVKLLDIFKRLPPP